ncbi:MAG: carbohydrate-binding family 9-like protein, partial [Lentisphaeria bacterium]|nr:carbohydrate-binding family 9-like protein [Lentisphaeria bacterium]
MKKFLLWVALCACSGAAFAANNGLVAVGKASGNIVVDGKLDDSAWQNCVSLTPFILQKQNRFAAEQTVAKLVWDDENLYVAFRCYDKALDPVNNRMPDFKANVKDNDSDKIFKDDCVILILIRNGKSYDFAINANGAVVDSSGEAKNIWKSRNRE